MSNKFCLYSFYRFTSIHDKVTMKQMLEEYLSLYVVKGTILLADEGINGSISAQKKDLDNIIKYVRKLLKIRNVNLKINFCDYLPFNRMKVRLKKEIVSLGKGKIKIKPSNRDYINPSEWNKIIKDNDINVIDVRNNFEIDIGNFRNTINPNTESFRDFPNKIKTLNLSKQTRIAMYCTGGIRCEKASSYLKSNGYKNIVQLKGGILNYLEYTKKNEIENLWNGECFVFDNRVTINKNLLKGKYEQCYGCRRPLTKSDKKSSKYQKGVSCSYCYDKRSNFQKNNSLVRQRQIDLAERKNQKHPFKKV